jgi:hypothetical protein
MSNRLEVLRERMHQEEARKAAKPMKTPKVAPSALPESIEPEVDISPLDHMNIIDDVVKTYSIRELNDPRQIIGLFNLMVFDEICRYKRRDFFKYISDNTLRNIVALQNAKNIRVAHELCYRILDSLEISLSQDEGKAVKRFEKLNVAIRRAQR